MIVSIQIVIYPLRQARTFASAAVGPRLGPRRWARAPFPADLVAVPVPAPLGGVIGIAVELGS